MTESDARGLVLAQGGLALAALIFLGAQTRMVLMERPILEGQNSVLTQRLSTMKATESQTDDALKIREEQIKRAQDTETRYAAMLTELLELSKVDPDARAITQKWKIQSAQPASPESSAPVPPASSQTRPSEIQNAKESKESKTPKPSTTPASGSKTTESQKASTQR